ncbi:MAG: NAD(P)/FAD-dependent oxidoreductase [Symploca sp. SIO1C2]|nr:NAD(P)/FAD-dependent oxidoreductase [Symploca sp. SIO1C2]
MAVDYDLIVIGGSTAGTYAAMAAAHLNARVALVEPEDIQSNWLGYGTVYNLALTQIGHLIQQVYKASQLGIQSPSYGLTEQEKVPSINLTEVREWIQTVVNNCSERYSPAILASLGVDVITGKGEFCRRPYLGFVVNNRRLRARGYLIATGSRPTLPDIPGLQTIGYLTPPDIWREERVATKESGSEEEWENAKTDAETRGRGDAGTENSNQSFVHPPEIRLQLQGNWVVIGGSSISIQLAQTLRRFNCQVTLVTEAPQILIKEDLEASLLVQAQLESEGIEVLTQSPVTQVRQIDNKKWVQAGNRAIEADKILLATAQQLNLESLNLEGVGVKFNQQGLQLNNKLQTTNPRIYACGDVTNGYQFAHIAEYEASIALKNALFAPVFKVNYQCIPWAIYCQPQLAGVGLTEEQAKGRYGKDVLVVKQYFKTLDKAQLLGETTGFCKLLVRRNGEIVGASLVGAEASELMGAIALAMQQKIKLAAIAKLPHASPTLSEIVHKTAIEWQRQCFRDNQALQNFLEGFFNLRRKL